MPRRRSGVTAGRLRKVGVEIGVHGIDNILANIARKLTKASGAEAKKVFMNAAMILVREAKDFAPVKTGALRDSIHAAYGDPKKSNVIVGVNYKKAPHAWIVEYGSVRTRPHPYMRPAIAVSRSPMAASLATGMKDLILEERSPGVWALPTAVQMPSVEAKMFSIMSNAAGITALVPGARIKVQGDWQNLPRPYIMHFPVAAQPIHTHNEGLMSLRIWRFYQVSIFADTYSAAIAIRDAVITALDGYKDADVNRIAYRGPGGSGDFDTDLKVQHLALNFEVAGGLSG